MVDGMSAGLLVAPKRNHYFYGKLMDVAQFNKEQSYLNHKRWLLNRLMFGGGIICGLKVVRLDDRRIDWGVAVVRCLGGFLSLAIAGLGFIWVAFDDEKQSWHDKIAGTTIVRVPKGTPLL